MAVIYKSVRGYKFVGSGPEGRYPRITLARELAEKLVGRSYTVEIDESGVITLRPMRGGK